MKFQNVLPILEDIPFMSSIQGKIIYDLIIENEIKHILELGIAHGTGSCYMAAALDENKNGEIITIDNQSAIERKPNIYELAEKCNLSQYISPVFANSSYNWELMKLVDKNTVDGICQPIFDFCYIDGAHNFEIDTCAFYLVDKLLKPNGLLLFDDLNWTYAKSPSLKNSDLVKNMTDEEKNTPHIKKLIELVVLPHPNYHKATNHDAWFLISKKGINNIQKGKSINLKDHFPEKSLLADIKNILIKIKNRKYKLMPRV